MYARCHFLKHSFGQFCVPSQILGGKSVGSFAHELKGKSICSLAFCDLGWDHPTHSVLTMSFRARRPLLRRFSFWPAMLPFRIIFGPAVGWTPVSRVQLPLSKCGATLRCLGFQLTFLRCVFSRIVDSQILLNMIFAACPAKLPRTLWGNESGYREWATINYHHDSGCSPHLCVGFLFLVLYPAVRLLLLPSSLVHTLSTHNLSSHKLLTHNLSSCNLLTHNLSSYNLLTHNLSSHNLLSHNLLTHHTTCSHRTCSHTTCHHTTCSHTTYSHTTCSHTICSHRTWPHTHTTCSHTTCHHTTCSHTTCSHRTCSHTQLVITQLAHTQLTHTQLALTQFAHTQLVITQLAHTQLVLPLRCRRGTYGTGLGVVARLVPVWRRGRRGCLRGRRGTWRHQPSLCVAGLALMALGWLWWRAWFPFGAVGAAAVCVAGVALGDMDLHFAWQAWHLVTWILTLRGKRGTYGTGLALVARLVLRCRRGRRGCLRGRRGTWRHGPSFATGVALGDINRHFVWQAWHLWHWAASGGALGSRLAPWAPRLFAWQAWHLATWTFTLRGRRGTWWHGSSLCVAGVALMALGWLWWRAWFSGVAGRGRRGFLRGRRGTWRHVAALCVAGVALWDITFVSRGRRGTWTHRLPLCVAAKLKCQKCHMSCTHMSRTRTAMIPDHINQS